MTVPVTPCHRAKLNVELQILNHVAFRERPCDLGQGLFDHVRIWCHFVLELFEDYKG